MPLVSWPSPTKPERTRERTPSDHHARVQRGRQHRADRPLGRRPDAHSRRLAGRRRRIHRRHAELRPDSPPDPVHAGAQRAAAPRREGLDRQARRSPRRRAPQLGARADRPEGFTHVGKLDGDVELPPHYFEPCCKVCPGPPARPHRRGAGRARGSGWRRVRAPAYHVHGATKLYSRECFEAVGGIEERLGWDTIDETYARMRGFRTRSFEDVGARHHRRGVGRRPPSRQRAHGECAYVVRYSLPWVLLRAVKLVRIGLRALRPLVPGGYSSPGAPPPEARGRGLPSLRPP